MKTIKAVKSKTEKTAAATPTGSPRRQTTVKPATTKAPAKKTSRVITTEVIASRAYILWEKAGRPPGRDVEYWLQAEKELKESSFAA
ncbi:MAG TPA: DUF2934 domain-containing protein [Verrucomicrobiae bacterium]